MNFSIVFKNLLNGSYRLTCMHRLQVISQGSMHLMQRDLVTIDEHKYIYPFNYEARRYISRKRSARIPPTKPLTFPNSGEIDSSLEYLNPCDPKPGFDVPELEGCNDNVKKIFSIGFADGTAVKEQRMENILKQVREHPADISSLEVKIAKMTIDIRTQMQHVLSCRKDKWAKRMLLERIQKRRSWINQLRKRDIKKFDWLLKELKIKYIPYTEFNFKIGKRALAKKAARDHFLAIKKQKMDEFREKLEQEREAFDKVKDKELQIIENELKLLGIQEIKSLQGTLDALKQGKHMLPQVKKRMRRRERILAKKFELYKHKREESLKN